VKNGLIKWANFVAARKQIVENEIKENMEG